MSRERIAEALGRQPSDEQWAVIEADLAPAVVIAGAGSGKTFSMAARVAHLVAAGYARPDEVLGLTFTTKATAELLSRTRGVLARLGPTEPPPEDGAASDPVILTYHAFAARILSEHAVRLGLEPGASVLSDSQRHQLAHRLVCRTAVPLGDEDLAPLSVTGQLLSLDAALAELCITTDRLRAFDGDLIARFAAQSALQSDATAMLGASRRRRLLADLVDEWRAEKAGRSVVDFSDQLRLAWTLVTEHRDIAEELRSRHRFVLLDEYQDTSVAQRRIMQALFGEGHSVLAVGDPAQAIYGWRGASVANITEFRTHFPAGPGVLANRYDLTTNRRSGAAILAVANEVAVELRAEHGLLPLEPAPDRDAGLVQCALLSTHGDEVAWVASRIAECPPGQVDGEPTRWRHIAVLCARREDAAAVEAELVRRGIPAYVAGAASLLAQPAVVEVRAHLELMHDPTANPAFIRLAAGPRWRIGARDLAALGDRAAHLAGGRSRGGDADLASALDKAVLGSDPVDTISLLEAAEDPGDSDAYSPDALARLTAMAREIRELRRHSGEPVPDVIHRVLAHTGLDVEISLGDAATVRVQQDAVAAFIDLAGEANAVDGRLTLGGFLATLRDAERFDVDVPLDPRSSEDAVQLLTVHKAKGLEWPVVFVPFLSEKAWPNGKARSQWPKTASMVPWPLRDDCDPGLDGFPPAEHAPVHKEFTAYVAELSRRERLEDRRLAYVAMTRAMDRLVLSGHWWGADGQATRRGPHEFLLAGHGLLAGLDGVLIWTPAPDDDAGNPATELAGQPVAWPANPWPERRARLLEAAAAVSARMGAASQPDLPGLAADADDVEWTRRLAVLVDEERARRRGTRTVRLPESVSATLLGRAVAHEDEVARELARPMPRPASPAADRGTRFHEYVESRFGQQSLIDPDDLPGAADADIRSDDDLMALKAAFERSPYAQRRPVAVEAPFSLLVDGRVVVGRIDAVFAEGERFEVVDWKTGSAEHVDPMQLALYRLAWARIAGVPLERIDAAFVFIATGEVMRPDTDAAIARLAVSPDPSAAG